MKVRVKMPRDSAAQINGATLRDFTGDLDVGAGVVWNPVRCEGRIFEKTAGRIGVHLASGAAVQELEASSAENPEPPHAMLAEAEKRHDQAAPSFVVPVDTNAPPLHRAQARQQDINARMKAAREARAANKGKAKP